MRVVIFLGPSIALAEARAVLPGAIFLPPAAQGDIYRAAVRIPHAIGIIDGYFEHVPSVWHKEILWAMKQGTHVFGASSMGALRAAELAQFGMVGVGKIFDWYAAGTIEDDDEVAVAHASAEDGFLPTSTAMVDIRATLEKAEAQHIISSELRTRLETIAKNLFYAERNYPTILQLAESEQLTGIGRLKNWLVDNKVHQKQDDAKLLLLTLQEKFAQPVFPLRVPYSFQHTQIWERAVRQIGQAEAQILPDALARASTR